MYEAIIRTNSAATTLTINAEHDTIHHYETVGRVDAQKIDMYCYNEYGKAAYIKVTEGKVVAKSGGKIEVVFANNTDSSKVAVAKEDNAIIEKGLTTVQVVSDDNLYNYEVLLEYSADGETPYTAEAIEAIATKVVESAIEKENYKGDVYILLDGDAPDAGRYATLAEFRDEVNGLNEKEANAFAGYTITLQSNVNLNDAEWTPIGTSGHPFSGIFDGNGKTISNYTINSASGDDGLFGIVKGTEQIIDYKAKWDSSNYSFNYLNLGTEYTAVIKNLIVDNAKVTTTSTKKSTGAVIGSATYATVSNIAVKNSTIIGEKGVGGVIGNIDGSFVENCTSDSSTSVLARVYNVGGVIGITANTNNDNVKKPSMIYNCSNYATVTINGTTGYAGGILGNGQNAENNVIADCHNFGKIKAANTNLLTSPNSENSGIAGIAGSGNGVYLYINCVNEETASFEVATSGEGVVQNFFNSVAGISFYGSGKNYCNCVNKASFSVPANKIAGITVAENTILKGCSNEGTLVNTLIPSAVYDLSSDMKVINIENINFESISQLNEEIASQFNSVGNAVNVSLKNVTINNLPGTGTLIVPDGIQTITSNTKVCDSVQLIESLVTLNMYGLNQAVSGTKSLYIGGSNNTIQVLQDTSMGTIVLDGNNNSIINNGTLSEVSVRGSGSGLSVSNNGTLGHLSVVASTSSVELTNNGIISNTNGNAIHVEAACTLIINNHGTIYSSSFAMLLYDGCDVTINVYSSSVTTGEFAPYRGNNTIKIYYQEGATINNQLWTTQASANYHVVVYKME